LVYGEVNKEQQPLYIRLHSSCVTSETLRGCDCDCVQQLEGAFKIITEKQHGILFYLLQEGRGAGYVSKARDRMLVQASFDQISTFQAYQVMGLKKDHRKYENIPDICHLLGIGDAQFIVLTNNPDKIQALTENGLCVLRTEPLEFEPSAFNVAYLSSKRHNGHLLRSPIQAILLCKTAPIPVVPFKPYVVPDAHRFIYCASYYLPMKPIDDEIVLNEEQYQQMFQRRSVEYYMNLPNPCVLRYQHLRTGRYIITIDIKNLKKYEQQHENDPVCELLTTPYWFKVTKNRS
jgi:3,4-dihydroxy 2-butanone 4-phosphate synthase/GTP cyclohydrolase II